MVQVPNTLRFEYDDSVLDVIEKINVVLKERGLTIVMSPDETSDGSTTAVLIPVQVARG